MTPLEMTPPSSGNTTQTKGQKITKSKNYLLTVNEKSLEHYSEIKNYLLNLKSLNYFLCTEHIGQENKHYHIFVQFKNSIPLSLKKLYGSHVEICFGSPQQNKNYCMAEDEKHKKLNIKAEIIDEEGELRQTGGKTIREIREMSIEDREDLPPQYKRIIDEINEEEEEEKTFINMLREIKNKSLKGPNIIYLTGETGNGKTYKAYEIALERYPEEEIGRININNNFFKMPKKNKKCYIIEEFRSSQIRAADFLQLTDKYGYSCNTKGGFRTIRPETIIICSIIRPQDLYKNEEINQQFLRRITEAYEIVNHELIKYDLKEDDDLPL